MTDILNMDTTSGPLWTRLEGFGDSASLKDRFPRFVSCFPRLLDGIKQAFACALEVSGSTDNKADIAIYGLGRLCLEDFTEIVFLVENGFDYAALKLLRGLYERVVVTETIIESPVEEAARFFDYYLVDERKWNRRGKRVDANWNEDPNGLAESYEERKDKFTYEPCATCGRPPQQSWTKHGLDALAGELGKATNDRELRKYGKELRHLYFFCAALTNPHIHASMFSIMQRLSGRPTGQLDPGNYALCYAHLLLVVAIDAQNRRFALGMDALVTQLLSDRSMAWLGSNPDETRDGPEPDRSQPDESHQDEKNGERSGFDPAFQRTAVNEDEKVVTQKATENSSSVMEDREKLDEQTHAWAWKLVNEQLKALGVAVVSPDLVWFRNLLFALLKSAILDYCYVEQTSKLTDARMMAWGRRNLLELTVITEFVLESETNAVQFQTEIAKDTAEFHAALSETQRHLHRRILDELSEFAQTLPPEFQTKVDQHVEEQRKTKTDTSATDAEAAAFRKVLKELNVDPKEYRPIMSSGKDGYADRIGKKKEFDPVFRICSKLMHRTALSISSENTLDSLKPLVPILRSAALTDLLDISGRIKNHIDAHGIRPT